jgi:2-polyprenyl-6-methoxyphenol hydroxylase-like FAD-dependent oxidoreductase
MEDAAESTDTPRVIVSGGSMGGLFAGFALRQKGLDVTVFEQTAGELKSRGAGIVAQPSMLRHIQDHDIVSEGEITTTTGRRQYLSRNGTVEREFADSMTFTSWDAVYRRLREAFPDERYRMGREVVGVSQNEQEVIVEFADGNTEKTDLFVVAEGGQSDTRTQLCPEVSPEYAGYVAWRGLIDEEAVSESLLEAFENTFVFHEGESDLILGYLIPGPDGGTTRGDRRLNWVWYDNADRERLSEVLTDSSGTEHEFSVPPGELREDVHEQLHGKAEHDLPDPFSGIVTSTPNPFVQTIYDLSVPTMVFNRTCLLGDAAFVARPHTAAGTAKAASDGISLADALSENGVPNALSVWEAERLEAGERLVKEGIRMGEGYMNTD